MLSSFEVGKTYIFGKENKPETQTVGTIKRIFDSLGSQVVEIYEEDGMRYLSPAQVCLYGIKEKED